MLDQQSPDVTAAPAGEVDQPRRLLRGRARKFAVGLTSLFVVLLGVGYVVAPSNPSIDMTVEELDHIPPYDVELVAQYTPAEAEAKRYKETIWGLIVSPDGVPVSQAKLTLQGIGPKVRKNRAVISIGGPTTFRSIVHLRPGKYRFTMSLRADGKMRTVSKEKNIKNKRFYGVGVLVEDGGIVTMVPIRTY